MQEAPTTERKTLTRGWRVVAVVVRVVTLWMLDTTLKVVLWLGARTRRVQPTRRSRLTGRPDIRSSFLRQQRGKCAYCSTAISDSRGNYEVDHKTPLARQGADDHTNLQALCRGCNKEKGARNHREYLHYRKYRKDLATYADFKRLPKYLNPRELLWRASLPLVLAPSVIAFFLGAATIERPLLSAGIIGFLAIAWTIGLWIRGNRTGSLDQG